jgi:alpha-beta hydrolase superfamily lysophospholipase
MFKTDDGLSLFEQYWVPDKEHKAVVAIVHGYAEHSARYQHVAEYLLGQGYAVEAFDLRGHGRSEGKRSFVKSFDEYPSDVASFFQRIRKRHPDKPIYLLGHSMGGPISLLFVATFKPDLKGLILSGPALKISDDISPMLVRFSSFISSIFPKLPTIKLDSSGISRDPDIVKRYDSDPLVYRGGTPARTGAELVRAIVRVQNQAEQVTLPILILHGTADKLADVEGSKQFYNVVGSNDKDLKLYDGFYHEVLNEPEKQQVLEDIVQWLKEH